MEYRIRGIPGGLWRRVRDRAGPDLREVLHGLLLAYADGLIDPLASGDPVAAARGAKGGHARAEAMSAQERSAAGRAAVTARWAKGR